MILLIDNYDSFTYNLYHYLLESGEKNVIVRRNDKISVEEIKLLDPKAIVLSPGPCTPNESGVCLDVIKEFSQTMPILGVCLGHQAIGQIFGAKIVKNEPMHGKVSEVFHGGQGIFQDIPSPFKATRYHSLAIEKKSFPNDELEITAATQDGIIMGISHKKYQIYGVQFHPESIASEFGHKIIENFIKIAQRRRNND